MTTNSKVRRVVPARFEGGPRDGETLRVPTNENGTLMPKLGTEHLCKGEHGFYHLKHGAGSSVYQWRPNTSGESIRPVTRPRFG